MNNKKIAFIDIEANQFKKRIYMLEFSVLDKFADNPIKFIECHQKHPLNIKVSQLLKKNIYYYKNKRTSELEAYKQLLKISKEYQLICFGDYDQTILNSVAKRYNLEKIELRNYLDELKEIFNISKHNTPSLNNFKNICEIEWNKDDEHNSIWDAKYLREIFLKIEKNKNNKLFVESYKNRLKIESLRPKRHKYENNKVINTITSSEYKIIFFKCKKIKDIDKENPLYLREVKVAIYNNKMQLISKFEKTIFNKSGEIISYKNWKLIKKEILNKFPNYIDNLLIFDGKIFWNIFFKKEKGIYWSPNKLSENIFNKNKLSFEQKLNIIKSFYKDGGFDNKINYRKLIKSLKNQ